MTLPDLPIRTVLEPLRAALAARGAAVLIAPPGAGKTTVVPLALLDAKWLGDNKIIVLEPRRLATRAAAQRMASLLGEEVGETAGYRVRRDTRVGPETRIEVVTEGILTRMLQSDPALDDVGLLVFDEFHERSVHADLGLALALQTQRLFRNDLRLLVMSATLDAAPVAALLDDAVVIEADGRAHPVQTRYRDRPIDGRIEPIVAAQVARTLRETSTDGHRSDNPWGGDIHFGGADPGDDDATSRLPGGPAGDDILVFLPGAGEIRHTAERLRATGLPGNVDLRPLFGGLSRRDQDAAIAPSPKGRRKVVLATAIAQTSLTIEGVRVVVDSGLMRLPRFNPGTGMTGLETLRVTADVADQRRGRAGRTAPGVCYRLWTETEQRGLVPQLRPEIFEADLAPLMLELALWGAEPEELTWPDPPPAPAVRQARELLRELDAVAADNTITEQGRQMAGLGVHPRLAHMLVRAREMKLGPLACDLAALLSERGVLRREAGAAPDADLRLQVEAVQRARRDGARGATPQDHRLHPGRLRRTLEEARTLRRALGLPRDAPMSAGNEAAAVEHTGELLALAYPDRVGRRRAAGNAAEARGRQRSVPHSDAPHPGTRYLLRNGRGAELPDRQSLARHEWIVASDLGDHGRDARIYQAAPIELPHVEALFAAHIEEIDDVRWNAETKRVEATRRRQLGVLVVAEAPLHNADASLIVAALLDGIRASGLRVLPWNKKTRQLHERFRFMHHADPDTWPDVSEEALLDSLSDWLGPFLSGMRRLDDLSRLDLAEVLWTHIGWQHREALERMAPTHLEVPSGSRIPLDYADPRAPALAVRLQEVFGWSETPCIGGGRVPVTLRLLSPAQRPVQVTTDLASFWRDAYFEVKKDLKGRYPKHYWPDDPLRAKATRRVRPT